MSQLSNVPRQLNSTQVLLRFGMRVIILAGFAAFGSIGYLRSFAALLSMSVVLCVLIGSMRREGLFGPILNHWDEAVAHGALFCLVSGISALLAG